MQTDWQNSYRNYIANSRIYFVKVYQLAGQTPIKVVSPLLYVYANQQLIADYGWYERIPVSDLEFHGCIHPHSFYRISSSFTPACF